MQVRDNDALRTAAGSAVLHVPPTRVLHVVAVPPVPQTPTPTLSSRGTPVSEVRRRALEARASAEMLRRQNHQLQQENLTPPSARLSALARARGSGSSPSLCTPQLRDRDRPSPETPVSVSTVRDSETETETGVSETDGRGELAV